MMAIIINCFCIASCYSTAPCIKIFQLLLGEVNDCTNWRVSDTPHTLGLVSNLAVTCLIFWLTIMCHVLAGTPSLSSKTWGSKHSTLSSLGNTSASKNPSSYVSTNDGTSGLSETGTQFSTSFSIFRIHIISIVPYSTYYLPTMYYPPTPFLAKSYVEGYLYI